MSESDPCLILFWHQHQLAKLEKTIRDPKQQIISYICKNGGTQKDQSEHAIFFPDLDTLHTCLLGLRIAMPWGFNKSKLADCVLILEGDEHQVVDFDLFGSGCK